MRKSIKIFLVYSNPFYRHVHIDLVFVCLLALCVFWWVGGLGLFCCWHYLNDQIFQSLEALHDGDHEKQRRHFLYFLLHQVPVSSNFSILTRKLACQVFTFRFLCNCCCVACVDLVIDECKMFWLILVAIFSDSTSYCTPRLQDEPTMPSFWMCTYVVCNSTLPLVCLGLNLKSGTKMLLIEKEVSLPTFNLTMQRFGTKKIDLKGQNFTGKENWTAL